MRKEKKKTFPAVECTYTVGMLYDLLGLYILRNLIAELEHLMTKLKNGHSPEYLLPTVVLQP